jgi:hypothetical protein
VRSVGGTLLREKDLLDVIKKKYCLVTGSAMYLNKMNSDDFGDEIGRVKNNGI